MKIHVSLTVTIKCLTLNVAFCMPTILMAEGSWPKEIHTAKADITVYQPQPDSMKGDHLYSRAAVSLTTPQHTTPVFGAVWTDARFSTDRESATCNIFDVKILNVRFPGIDTIDPVKVQNFKKILVESANSWNLEFSLDELKSTLATDQAAMQASANLKNDPPEIIYVKQPSVLVIFDGDPVLKEIENSGLKRIINTPCFILQDLQDKKYYLYGGISWYISADPVKSPWKSVDKPSAAVSKYYDAMTQEMVKQGKEGQQGDSQDQTTGNKIPPPSIIIRTSPAELIQSKGEPQYAPIQGTQLLYMTNTSDNIFMTIDKNQYYILLSGRWYCSSSLSGPWSFVGSDKLPSDFAKIPEGSEKDIVLASIAETAAAKDAVMDAQIPQTAAVDRKTAKCTVKWDGDPKFEMIAGTDLARGMNTSSTILLYKNIYYVCDNAIWFTGKGPVGPWEVATTIPGEIQKIPPSDPAYNVKYVYIYDVQPEIVYVGYTPGYMGCYIYGPTVVYGTGYPYPPFYGPYYYPRPVTFGFGMHYNPWYGWSMGFSMSVGIFTFSMGGPMGFPGGWWGPPMYRPLYHPPYSHYYGPHPPVYHGGGNTININNSRNIYTSRGDGSVKPYRQPSAMDRPSGRHESPRPGTKPAATDQKNNVFTDGKGNVYRNENGNWQKNNGSTWGNNRPASRSQGGGFSSQELNRQSQARDRGTQSTINRSNMQRTMPGGSGGSHMNGAGGARRK